MHRVPRQTEMPRARTAAGARHAAPGVPPPAPFPRRPRDMSVTRLIAITLMALVIALPHARRKAGGAGPLVVDAAARGVVEMARRWAPVTANSAAVVADVGRRAWTSRVDR